MIESPASYAPATTPSGNVKGIKRTRVLIVEDHVSLRELLADHLTNSACYEVVGQTSQGREVVAECERLKPQILILDLDLPDQDGLDVIAEVRVQSPETQILVFSALTDAGTVRRAIEAGACGFVEKTVAVDTLDRAIAAVSLGQPFYGDVILQALPAVLFGQGQAGDAELSPREREVLALVANGHNSREIATGLGLSVRTVENHRSNIMHALGARNTADLTREAMRLGLVQVARRKRSAAS
jgi:DNA-binding NarL/FixJ family response regulator